MEIPADIANNDDVLEKVENDGISYIKAMIVPY